MRKLLFLYLLFCLNTATSADSVHVAVASNFKQTAERLGELFEKTTGHESVLSSASTGTLHSQITRGAPFDVLLSADAHSPRILEAAGFSRPGNRFCYALGQLVLVGGSGSLADLANPELSLAIANPATAPYGIAAEEVLNLDHYKAAAGRKTVRANNVVHAFQYWFTSSVDIALVAQSLTDGKGVKIPPENYQPIKQEAVWLNRGLENSAAKSYIAFLKSRSAQDLIASSGYGNCE
ncbi:MAG: molybdate transport system substrate-binding protein [Halioglobus sp.]|jgi:molybdate transport system substrate-binding protein